MLVLVIGLVIRMFLVLGTANPCEAVVVPVKTLRAMMA
jgi:hypothetical protein